MQLIYLLSNSYFPLAPSLNIEISEFRMWKSWIGKRICRFVFYRQQIDIAYKNLNKVNHKTLRPSWELVEICENEPSKEKPGISWSTGRWELRDQYCFIQYIGQFSNEGHPKDDWRPQSVDGRTYYSMYKDTKPEK